jgi:vacuolar-type H+-ATPase subunit I/STV1
MKKLALAVLLLVFFVAGYITGSIQTRDSIALELGGLTGVGGTVESLKSLGKTIVEMQDNVNKLQKNINDVKKVRDDVSKYQGVYDKVIGKEPPQKQLKDQQQNVSPELQKGIQQMLTPEQTK